MTPSFIAIIPARRGSTRLPNKPLLDIAGLPMVVRTAQQAAQSNARQVVVATDDEEILNVVQHHGFTALLTRPDHASGTDRLAEAAQQLALTADSIVVNVQGDEPLIEPDLINQVAALLAKREEAHIATCACPITSQDDLHNPNQVKVVTQLNQLALYFSRSPLPWAQQLSQPWPDNFPAYRHIGLYAYRTEFLQQFSQLTPGVLEQFEKLEQLRALENGYQIVVQPLASAPAPGVDTEADLERVRRRYLE